MDKFTPIATVSLEYIQYLEKIKNEVYLNICQSNVGFIVDKRFGDNFFISILNEDEVIKKLNDEIKYQNELNTKLRQQFDEYKLQSENTFLNKIKKLWKQLF